METQLKPLPKKQNHRDPEQVSHISMNMVERLCFRMGLLSRDTLQNDMINRIKSIKRPMTLVTPISGKPVLVKSSDLHPAMALSLLTGWIEHPLYTLASRLIKPYDSVLELGGTQLHYAFHTALKSNPVSYHYSREKDSTDLSHIHKIADLNHLQFLIISQKDGTPEDSFDLISARPYTVILINQSDMAVRLADTLVPLALRHLIINTADMTVDARQDMLNRFSAQHFSKQSHSGDAIHLMRGRKS